MVIAFKTIMDQLPLKRRERIEARAEKLISEELALRERSTASRSSINKTEETAVMGDGMSGNNRYVVNHPNGWATKAAGATRASSVHSTQRGAEIAAKRTVKNLGGGEVRIQGRNGQWRDSDTVAPGNTRTRSKIKNN